jgi:hypothetical protein
MGKTNDSGPSYYKRGNTDVWDFIREQGLNFHLGNAIKYICRAGYKEDRTSDLRKAIHYLQNELENEILSIPPSTRVSGCVQGSKQQEPSFPNYSEVFDR